MIDTDTDAMTDRKAHDPTRMGLCPCRGCDVGRLWSIAESRAGSAIQASAWHPRSKRLREARLLAIQEREYWRAAASSFGGGA